MTPTVSHVPTGELPGAVTNVGQPARVRIDPPMKSLRSLNQFADRSGPTPKQRGAAGL